MAQLDDIEKDLRAAIDGQRLRLSADLAQALDLPAPPDWLGALVDLEIQGPIISRPAALLVLSGGVGHPQLGAAVFTVEVAVIEQGLSPRVRWAISEPPPLADLLTRLGLGFAAGAARFVDAIVARGVRLQALADGDTTVTVEVSGALTVSLAGLELSIAFSSVAFASRGTRAAQIRGSVNLAGLVLPLSVTLDDPVRISAVLPNLSLLELIRALGLPAPVLPPLPILATPLEALQFSFEPDLRLSGRVPVGGVGALTFVVAQVDSQLVLAAGLDVAPGFSFGSLLPALGPLDQLQQVVRLRTPALVVATEAVRNLPYPASDGGWVSLSVVDGPAFQGELLLSGLGLDLIGTLLSLDRIPFHIPLTADLADLRLVASLPLRLAVIPGVLMIEGVEVDIAVQPFAVSAAGRAELNLFGAQLPALELGIGTSGAQQVIFLRTAEPWVEPLGLPFNIEALGLQLSTPPPAYGFFGKIMLKSRTLEVAAKFVGQAPSMLAAEAHGDLALSNLLAEFIGVDLLPDYFEPSLRDPAIYLVLNPAGEMIAGRLYPTGVGVAGAMQYLGLGAHLSLSAKLDRVVAEAALSGPVRFPPVLELTGPGGVGAPSFALDTQGDPILTLGARVSLMGLVQDVRGVVGTTGVRIDLEQRVGPVEVALEALLGEGRFQATGDASFALKGSVGPIRVGGLDLGEIQLDAGFNARVSVRADGSGAQATVHGAFSFLGIGIELPEISVSPDAFARLPEQALAYIRDHAADLFAEMLRSADAWLRAIAEGIVRGVENVARVLKEHFEQQAEAIARGLTDTLKYTTEQTARALMSIGESVESVGRALSAIGRSPEEVAKALVDVGYPVKAVTEVLKGLGLSGEDAARLLAVANIPSDVVKKVIEEIFNIAPDVHLRNGIPSVFIRAPHLRVPHTRVFVRAPHVRVHARLPHVRF